MERHRLRDRHDFAHHFHHGHHGHRRHGYRGWPHGMRRFVGARLHRRIFVWFGVSILITAAVTAAAWSVIGPDLAWRDEIARLERFAGNRFAAVWSDAAAREELGLAVVADLDMTITLLDAQGAVLMRAGRECQGHVHHVAVPPAAGQETGTLGALVVCKEYHGGRSGPLVLVMLGTGALCLWLGAGLIAHRLVRPLGELYAWPATSAPASCRAACASVATAAVRSRSWARRSTTWRRASRSRWRISASCWPR